MVKSVIGYFIKRKEKSKLPDHEDALKGGEQNE